MRYTIIFTFGVLLAACGGKIQEETPSANDAAQVPEVESDSGAPVQMDAGSNDSQDPPVYCALDNYGGVKVYCTNNSPPSYTWMIGTPSVSYPCSLRCPVGGVVCAVPSQAGPHFLLGICRT